MQFLHLDPDPRLGSSNSYQCGSGSETLTDREVFVYLLSGDGGADLPALVVDLAQPQVGENKREVEICTAPKHKAVNSLKSENSLQTRAKSKYVPRLNRALLSENLLKTRAKSKYVPRLNTKSNLVRKFTQNKRAVEVCTATKHREHNCQKMHSKQTRSRSLYRV